MTTTKTDKPAAERPRKMARAPKPQNAEALLDNATAPPGNGDTLIEPTADAAAPAPSIAKATTKTAAVLDLLTRPEVATLEQMVAATGWLPHTTRAALTGLKKKGHELTSIKADGVRTYRVTRAQPSEAKTSEEIKSKPAA